MFNRDQYVAALRDEATRARDDKHLQEIRAEIAKALGVSVEDVALEGVS